MENRSVLSYCSRFSSLFPGLQCRSALILSVLTVSIVFGHAVVHAAGPWRGQVVDAETGAALQSVVVVAIWAKESPGFIHPERKAFDVDELVTDVNGRFTIPARDTSTWIPGTKVLGPLIHMFKGGYGVWQFRDTATPYPHLESTIVRQKRLEEQRGKLLDEAGVVIQLPRIRTREGRLQMMRSSPLSFEVPVELIPQWIDAYSRERVFLGLSPWPEKP